MNNKELKEEYLKDKYTPDKEEVRECDRECRINSLGGMERCDDACDCGAVEHNERLEEARLEDELADSQPEKYSERLAEER